MKKHEEQYNTFKGLCEEQNIDWIFEHYYKIGFYKTVFNELDNNSDIPNSVFPVYILVETGKVTIESLFYDFIKLEWSSYEDLDTLLDFFEYVTGKYYDDLFEIANRYSTSIPIKCDNETTHEQKTISDELGVSMEEAKGLMISVLGFDESDFE